MKDIRVFRFDDGWEILIGRTAAANDRLSFKIGHPNDYWFHAAGVSGAHVVARHPQRPERLSRDVKRIAAGLAVFYSKGRQGGTTCVHYTTCGSVVKRRSDSPGKVRLKRHQSFFAKPLDPESIGGMTC